MLDPLNYEEPNDPEYFCKKQDKGGWSKAETFCVFPQDVRSLSKWGKKLITGESF